jgi:hypothetical protein
MNTLEPDRAVVEITGVVQRIDDVARQVEVLVQGVARLLDVPTGCDVFLNGERVKLRLLQPSDRARLICVPGEETWTARSILVSSWGAPV